LTPRQRLAAALARWRARHPGLRHPSLRRRLLFSIGVPLLLWTVVSAYSDYRMARSLTDDAYDQSLAGTAEGLAVRLETDRDADVGKHLDAAMRLMARIDKPDTWHYLVLDAQGRPLSGDLALRPHATLDPDANPSYHTTTLGHEEVRVATYTYSGADGRATIIVAESTLRRRDAVRQLVGATLWPNLLLVLVAMLAIWLGVRVAVRPLDALGEQMAEHPADDLTELPLAGTPRETLPLLRELNALLGRVRLAAQAQQVFLGHAAHQLRTPLAALQAQIELWRQTPAQADPERLQRLHTTVLRLGHLTRQLLTLARADAAAAAALVRSDINLPTLIEAAAAEFDELARGRGVALAFELAPATVAGVDWMLRELLQNLVDNATAHAPAGSEVIVRCGRRDLWPRHAFIEVDDAGPGVAPWLRQRVFEPFVRLDNSGRSGNRNGSGLGLAIVREIADRHHAAVRLEEGPGHRGTRVCIEFA
jgi:two-component system sensor histidine kinase TctE